MFELWQGRETIDLGGGKEVATRAYVASFNLRGAMQETRRHAARDLTLALTVTLTLTLTLTSPVNEDSHL